MMWNLLGLAGLGMMERGEDWKGPMSDLRSVCVDGLR